VTDTQTLEGAVALLQRVVMQWSGWHAYSDLLPEINAFLALPVSPDLPADAPGEGHDEVIELLKGEIEELRQMLSVVRQERDEYEALAAEEAQA